MVSLKKILNKILVRINSEADYVIEQGEVKGLKYRKWNSGRLDCFGKSYSGSFPGEPVGDLYRGQVIENLPAMFNSTPSHVYVTLENSAEDIVSVNGYALDSTRINWYIWSTRVTIEMYASWCIIGTWK